MKSRDKFPGMLVITERKEHLGFLAKELRKGIRNVMVLRGGMDAKQRRDVMDTLARIPEGEERIIVATGRYLGEGFDDARLDTLFLTMPISWRGTLAQYAGRLHRLHSGKREVRIYDYADLHVPILVKMHKKRLSGYQAIGLDIPRPSPRAIDHSGTVRPSYRSCRSALATLLGVPDYHGPTASLGLGRSQLSRARPASTALSPLSRQSRDSGTARIMLWPAGDDPTGGGMSCGTSESW
jgi:hypothetical protein